MERAIHTEHLVPYPIEQVWFALTDAATLDQWFMSNDFQSLVGHEFTFRKDPQPGWDGITWCEVITLMPMNKIAYTYRGRAGGEKALVCAQIKKAA